MSNFRFPLLCKSCNRLVERWDGVKDMCVMCHEDLQQVRAVQALAARRFPELWGVPPGKFVEVLWKKFERVAPPKKKE